MKKIMVEAGWGHKEEVELIKAFKGHYTMEFTFKGEHFYLVNDYEGEKKDLRVYSEQEFLLADEPEAMYRVRDKEEGRLPVGMFDVVFEAMNFGKKMAESGVAHLTVGY